MSFASPVHSDSAIYKGSPFNTNLNASPGVLVLGGAISAPAGTIAAGQALGLDASGNIVTGAGATADTGEILSGELSPPIGVINSLASFATTTPGFLVGDALGISAGLFGGAGASATVASVLSPLGGVSASFPVSSSPAPGAGGSTFLNNVVYTTQTTAGGGSGATLRIFTTFAGQVDSVTIETAGDGYTFGESVVCQFDGTGATTFTVTASVVNTTLASVTITAGGTLYSLGESLVISTVLGASATATVTALESDKGGGGYTTGVYPLIQGSGSGGTATITVVDAVGAVRAVSLTTGGKDYTSGDAAIQHPGVGATAFFNVLSVSGGGGETYTDADAIAALTTSTATYSVAQSMTAGLLASSVNVTTDDLTVTLGSIHVVDGDVVVQSGALVSQPEDIASSFTQYTATWQEDAGSPGNYLLKREAVAAPTAGRVQIVQPFTGGAAAVPVSGVPRGALTPLQDINNGAGRKILFWSTDPWQIQIVSYGNKYRVSMSGELQIGVGGIAQDSTNAIMWNSTLPYYFGDASSSQLINTGSAGARPYGPRTNIFLPMTLRLATPAATGEIYVPIQTEVHSQAAGGTMGDNYFMRFSKELFEGDRLLFDGVEYWTANVP